MMELSSSRVTYMFNAKGLTTHGCATGVCVEDLSISCYISRSDLALTLSIQLKGSRVADAAHDCRRQNSFKIWHLESGQCLFFAADDAIEYGSWFKEVTKGAEYVVPLDAGISNSPLAAPFYHFTKDSPSDSSPSQRSSRSSIASLPELDLDTAPVNSGGTVVYKGNLKKLTQNKWKDRHCVVKDSVLQVFATSSEKTLLTTMPLAGAGVELVSVPNEEVHHFTFRICIPSGKAHMFCAVSEQEMYAWATTLQDVAYQSSDVKEDPMAKSRKKVNSSTLKHIEKLFTPIPASSLSNPVHAGYAEVLALGSWQRYWCVVHSGALYLYQNHEYPTTTLTIVLKGYRITVGGPRGCKKPCVIAMQYPGLHTTFMSVLDQNELNVWFNALERGTRMESTIQHLRKPPEKAAMPATDVRIKVTPFEEADPPSLGTENKKTTVDEQLTETPLKKEETSGSPPQHIIRKYEKKVRKTHRVANVTEQNLKRQQASLMHFKRELSQTTGKLQELANKGDEHAIKRLKSVRVKLQQIDKILPYIGKYIMVNRQAEIQTVAILKESCTVDLQRVKGDATHAGVASQDPEPSRIPAHKPLETHEEEAECTATVEPTQHSSEVMASPLVSEQTTANPGITPPVPQNEAQEEVPAAEPLEPAPPTPLSSPELVEQRLSPHAPDDSPYANLMFLQSEAQKIHTKGVGRGEDPNVREESPYATLASVRPGEVASNQSRDEVQYAELVKVMSPTILSPAPKSPYAELDFTKMQEQQQQQQRLTPTSPRSRLNYVEVSFNAGKSKAVIADETDSKTEEIDTTLVARSEEKETTPLDETLTSVEQPLTLSTSALAHSAPSPKSRAAALQEAIKLFEPPHSSTPSKPPSSKAEPPPVKRKPKQSNPSANRSSIPQESFTSPSHTATEETGKKDTDHCSDDGKLLVSETDGAQSVATGTMSVLERIKALGIEVSLLCCIHFTWRSYQVPRPKRGTW
ncbi:hypothetical protein GBAR_LOCUS766 [Geodia barretti]|uniref:PH domain-containing protein n=1 Tax=Geodia barretti TaxID=519541 RepID=A0AA35QUJ5_GEOBA|nr:hypothetical protein GBAR_LOCUS766 [Geodia barretti]